MREELTKIVRCALSGKIVNSTADKIAPLIAGKILCSDDITVVTKKDTKHSEV